MSTEYYVIRPVQVEGDHESAYELVKYNSRTQVTGRGHVFKQKDGTFVSDDNGFKCHKNELASRRIRIVKKHLELGEPKFAAYYLQKNNVEGFIV